MPIKSTDMKYLKFVFIFVMFCGSTLQAQFYCTNNSSQNLVPNPGFESHTGCPDFFSELNLAAPWFAPTRGSPDYFNVCCDVSDFVSVPDNFAGTQTPHGGDAYGGGIMYHDCTACFPSEPEYREYLETPLLAAMTANHTYAVSFYVCMADISTAALDNLGAYFSIGPVFAQITGEPLPFTPQVRNPAGNFHSLSIPPVPGVETLSLAEVMKNPIVQRMYNTLQDATDKVMQSVQIQQSLYQENTWLSAEVKELQKVRQQTL